jgi:hypothetical protein
MKLRFVLVGFISGCLWLPLMGCHSDPYAGTTGKLSGDPVSLRPAMPVLSINAPDTVDMVEGTMGQFKVTGRVLVGHPVLKFEGLPQDASYSPTEGFITWKPPFGAAVDPINPTSTTNAYPVRVTLTSDDDPKTLRQAVVVILVHRPANSMNLSGLDTTPYIAEGQDYEATFQVADSAYANGPIEVSSLNAPPGVKITQKDSTQFVFSYTPPFNAVNTDNYDTYCYYAGSSSPCRVFKWTLVVSNPQKYATSFPMSWTVIDVRQNPKSDIPDYVNGTGLTADFYIRVEDPNGERIPDVVDGGIRFGTLTINKIYSEDHPQTGNPYAFVHVVWSSLGDVLKGTEQILPLKTCVNSNRYNEQTCVVKYVQVQFPGTPPAPVPTATPSASPSATPALIPATVPVKENP